jgi:CheY-like chemotaxis protein
MKILLAEDNDQLRKCFELTAVKLGHQCTAVCDGSEAWELLQAGEEFDLVVSDHNMPIMTSLELLKQLRGHTATSALRFVLYSGNESPDLEPAALALQASFESKTETSARELLAQYLPAMQPA